MRIQSGGGISFNGDSAAANALDDYEEGTFTPTVYGDDTAGSISGGTWGNLYKNRKCGYSYSFYT